MGLDIWANSDWTITWDAIKELAPEETAEFERLMKEYEFSLEDFVKAAECGDGVIGYLGINLTDEEFDGYQRDIDRAWDDVKQGVEDATRQPDGSYLLIESVEWHDQESEEDEVEGPVFVVGGVQKMTAAGTAFLSKINYSHWITGA